MSLSGSDEPFLNVRHLRVDFRSGPGTVRAVDDVTFSVGSGRTLGIVGESGAGKSALALAILGLHDPSRTEVTGEIRVGGTDIVGLPEREIRPLRGRRMALIVQNPLSALHPSYTAGRQIGEAFRAHHPRCSRREARRQAVDMMSQVGIPDSDRRVDDFPHRFSGGMRQRIMIAIALVNRPRLLVADEPTTALDVTVQAQVLDLLRELQQVTDMALVLVSHDIGVIARLADDVMVMYAGRVAEIGPVEAVLHDARHPYTQGLLAAAPALDGPIDADLPAIPGTPPDPAEPMAGCAFRPRCPVTGQVGDRCRTENPALRTTGGQQRGQHRVACHLAGPAP